MDQKSRTAVRESAFFDRHEPHTTTDSNDTATTSQTPRPTHPVPNETTDPENEAYKIDAPERIAKPHLSLPACLVSVELAYPEFINRLDQRSDTPLVYARFYRYGRHLAQQWSVGAVEPDHKHMVRYGKYFEAVRTNRLEFLSPQQVYCLHRIKVLRWEERRRRRGHNYLCLVHRVASALRDVFIDLKKYGPLIIEYLQSRPMWNPSARPLLSPHLFITVEIDDELKCVLPATLVTTTERYVTLDSGQSVESIFSIISGYAGSRQLDPMHDVAVQWLDKQTAALMSGRLRYNSDSGTEYLPVEYYHNRRLVQAYVGSWLLVHERKVNVTDLDWVMRAKFAENDVAKNPMIVGYPTKLYRLCS